MSQEPLDSTLATIEAAKAFEDWYETLQKNIAHFSQEPTTDTIHLVSSEGNLSQSIHCWYSLKESYDADLPNWVYQRLQTEYGLSPYNILDPFLGAGTTGVTLAQKGLEVVGVEYNPFIRFVSATKASVTQIKPIELEQAIRNLNIGDLNPQTVSLPELTTLHNPLYIAETDAQMLSTVLMAIDVLDCSDNIHNFLKLGVANIIDKVVNLRKDGRALRYEKKSNILSISELLQNVWCRMLEDVKSIHRIAQTYSLAKPLFTVFNGSSINLQSIFTLDNTEVSLSSNYFDAIIYSPPYLNNFDYSEVYKLELWMLEFIRSYDEWRNLRLKTLRSHYSISFPPTNYLASDPATNDVATKLDLMGDSLCIPQDQRRRLKAEIIGYFDDMYLALKEQLRVLKPGGMVVYVVANSRHYYLPIATDVILAEIARCIGFEPLELVVLRKRNGRTRQKHFLRESAVFLRKPTKIQ